MQKLAELNAEISKSITLNVIFNESIDNFKYNNKWVTDLPPKHFAKRIKKIEKLLDKNIDFDNKNHVKFIKVLYQDVIKAYKEQTKFNYENYSSFNNKEQGWDVELNFPNLLPNKQAIELEVPKPSNQFDDKAEYIIEIIKGFFNIDSNQEDAELDLNEILIKNYNIDESELNSIYAKAHLSYVIYLHLDTIKEIAYKIDNLLSIVQKLEGFSQNTNFDLEKIITNPKDVKLEFAMAKQDIAIFYHTLHELKIIKTDTENIHNSQTKLKSFINESNIYYKFKNELTRVGNIKKQFTDLNNKDVNHKEIEFLETLISKFTTRLEEIKSR